MWVSHLVYGQLFPNKKYCVLCRKFIIILDLFLFEPLLDLCEDVRDERGHLLVRGHEQRQPVLLFPREGLWKGKCNVKQDWDLIYTFSVYLRFESSKSCFRMVLSTAQVKVLLLADIQRKLCLSKYFYKTLRFKQLWQTDPQKCVKILGWNALPKQHKNIWVSDES